MVFLKKLFGVSEGKFVIFNIVRREGLTFHSNVAGCSDTTVSQALYMYKRTA